MAVPLPLAQEVAEEGGFQLDLVRLEAAAALRGAAQRVAAHVGAVIERCEAAREELGKAAALLFEPGEDFSDIGEAAELVRTNLSFAAPAGGLLQEARRELVEVILRSHPEAIRRFDYFTEHFDAAPGGEEAAALWPDHYHQAGAQAREALRRLDAADDASLAAHQALGLCQVQRAAGELPEAHLSDAEVRLQRAIHEVDRALTELREMETPLQQELELAILMATGEAPPPPA